MLLLTTWDPSLMSVSFPRSPSFLLSETTQAISAVLPLHSPFHCFHNNTKCVAGTGCLFVYIILLDQHAFRSPMATQILGFCDGLRGLPTHP